MSPVRPISDTMGITVYLWDPTMPPTPGQHPSQAHWRPCGYLVTSEGPAKGRFTYFPDYQGPPLDPINLDYRKHPKGAPFIPPPNTLWGVFKDILPGHSGDRLLGAHFPGYSKLNDMGKLIFMGRQLMKGLLLVPRVIERENPERYISGIEYLEILRQKVLQGSLVLDEENVYGLTSVGGARDKAAIELREGEQTRYYIAKFNHAQDAYDSMVHVEYIGLRWAAVAGIRTPNARVVELPKTRKPVLLVERFDRGPVPTSKQATTVSRAHCLSLKTLLGVDNTGIHRSAADVRDVAVALDKIGCSREEQDEWIRRIAYMAVAQISDNHLGNFEVMLDPQNQWRLTPAFDLVPTPGQSPFSTRICGFSHADGIVNTRFPEVVARHLKRPQAEVESLVYGVWEKLAQHGEDIIAKSGASPADQKMMREILKADRLQACVQSWRDGLTAGPDPR
ncbi:MAG: HipA domain-containing protein [Gammaproteobacteria bacterium]|nr:HipA domain-containing protein [Gammaproteobacteria bacterium]